MKYSISIVLALVSLPLASMAQLGTTVFNDSFTSSTIGQAPTAPTSTATSYEFFQGGSTTLSSPLSAANYLHLDLRSASSEIGEVQALFTTAPVTLATIGDAINLTVVFTNTANLMLSAGNSGSSLNIGLFNSGGTAPNQANGFRLSNGTQSGGSQGWNGYGAKFFTAASGQAIQARFPQIANGTTSQNQDLLFGSQSGGGGFNNPAGVSLTGGSSVQGVSLTSGSVYTLDYRITLSAANTLTISNAIYSGTGVAPGNLIFSQIASTNGATGLVYTYDGLALGWRYANATANATTMDISQMLVTDFIQPVPEPSALALAGLGIVGLTLVRRFRR